MPFVSKAQQRWMYATKPEMAKEWSKETNFKHLPERKKKKMQRGGVAPLVVTNPNDPRLRAYNDSLQVFNKYKQDRQSAINAGYEMRRDFSRFDDPNSFISNFATKPGSKYTDINLEGHRPIQPIIYKKPAQPEMYQKETTNEYDKKHPPIYLSNPKDPRIDSYTEAGNQYRFRKPAETYKEPPHPKPVAIPIQHQEGINFIPPTANYRPIDLTPKQTDFSITYTGDGRNQETVYLPDYNTWEDISKQTLADDGVGAKPSYQMNAAKTYGRSSGYRKLQIGGGAPRRPFVQTNTYATNGQEDSFLTDSLLKQSDEAFAPYEPPQPKRLDPWRNYLTMRAGVVGLSELSGRIDRSRQDQYFYNQASTLGQMNAMPIQDFQPNPYNLYMRMGGDLKRGGIHIDPSKRGTFKTQASKMGMSTKEAASHILAHPEKYSPAMRKKANFAKNFAK